MPRAIDPAHHDAHLRTRLLRTLTRCVLVLTIGAGMTLLWVLRDLLTPLIVAILVLILIDALARKVGRYLPATPQWLRTTLAFLFMIGVLVGAVTIIGRSAQPFATSLGGMKDKIEVVANTTAARLGLKIDPGGPFATLDTKSMITMGLLAIKRFATDLLFVIVYLGFLMASRSAFHKKVEVLFPDRTNRANAERVFDRTRTGAERYIGLQTFKAAILAMISWAVMVGIGLHNSNFLAFLIFLAAFIPLLGPAAGVIVPTVLALAQFDVTWQPIVLYVLLQTTVILVDNVLLPRMQADQLDVDPVVVLLSLGFWSLIFGVAGALLSTPLTVIVISIASEIPDLKWLAVILSKKGEPFAHDRTAAATG